MDPRAPVEGGPNAEAGQETADTVSVEGESPTKGGGLGQHPPAPSDDVRRGAGEAAQPAGENGHQAAMPGTPAEPSESSSDRAAAPELQRLQEELAAARREADQRLEQLKRVQADFANYRRRMMQEQGRWREQAIGDFVLQLLPVVDNLERALAVAPDGDPLKEGVAMVHRQMLETLGQAGVQPIEAEGQAFDPRLHEAVAREETRDVPDGHVIEVLQRGYLYQGRTLRPALVKVAVTPATVHAVGYDPAGAAAGTPPAAGQGGGGAGAAADAGVRAQGATSPDSGGVAAEQDGAEEATRG